MGRKKKPSKKIHWLNLTKRHKVREVGKPGNRQFVTGSGALIYWNGREARKAQSHLKYRSKRRK